MNRFRFLALLILLAAVPARAAAPVRHEGPATAAVPVEAVEKTSLAPPEGYREAPAEAAALMEVSLLPEAIPATEPKSNPRPAKTQAAKKKKDSSPAVRLAEISPASGGSEASSAGESQTDAFMDRIMAYHLPAGGKAKLGPKSLQPVTLEDLLSGAGLALNSFVPVENAGVGVILQWTVGAVSGLYERTASIGDFSGQVIGYIARYRENCGQGMNIHVSPAKIAKAGTVATVDIACAKSANSYAASFVFLEDGNGFSTILHTALPAEKNKVRGIRDAIAQKLNMAKAFEAPQAIGRDMAGPKLQLKVPPAAPSPDFNGVTDGLATVIIQ